MRASATRSCARSAPKESIACLSASKALSPSRIAARPPFFGIRNGALELGLGHRRAARDVQPLGAFEQLVLRQLTAGGGRLPALVAHPGTGLRAGRTLHHLLPPCLDDHLLAGLGAREAGHLLQAPQPSPEVLILALELSRVARQGRVGLPPIDPHLLGSLDRRNQETQLD